MSKSTIAIRKFAKRHHLSLIPVEHNEVMEPVSSLLSTHKSFDKIIIAGFDKGFDFSIKLKIIPINTPRKIKKYFNIELTVISFLTEDLGSYLYLKNSIPAEFSLFIKHSLPNWHHIHTNNPDYSLWLPNNERPNLKTIEELDNFKFANIEIINNCFRVFVTPAINNESELETLFNQSAEHLENIKKMA